MLIPLAVGSLAGTSVFHLLSTLPHPLHVVGVFCGCLLVVIPCIWFTNKQVQQSCLIILLAGLLGFSWTYFQAHKILLWHLPQEDIQQLISIRGKVEGITQWQEKTLRFDILVSEYAGQPLPHQAVKMRLYWKNAKILLTEGDNLQAKVKLKAPWHLANPGSVDQQKQFFLERIRAIGTVVVLEEHHPKSGYTLTKWRQHLNDRLQEVLGEKPFLGVIQATTLGIYKNITPEQWQVFQATGTTHAIAISGLHISFIAMLYSGFITFIVRRFQILTNYYPASCYGALGALLGSFGYCALAGFSIPTQRAFMMVMIALLALLKRQPIFSWQSLAYACLGVLAIDPLAPLQLGFWLSFGCVAALIYGSTHVDVGGWWRKRVIPQCVVFLGLLPLCSFFFQQISLCSPLANTLVLPLIDLVVVPASLIGLILMTFSSTLAGWCLCLAHCALELTWWILEKLSQIPFNMWQQGEQPRFYILLALIAAFCALAPKGLSGRGFCWLGFLPIIFYRTPILDKGHCVFTLLDVGQGLAAVVQTQHHTLLYDAGPQYGKQSDAGQRVIIPFLQAQHIKKIDRAIISHGDLDHRAGLARLYPWIIGEILSSEPSRIKYPSQRCVAGESWEWDGVKFAILSPFSFTDKKRNNLSCVLKVSTLHHSILLTGDIEQRAENNLLARVSDNLPSTILVVPHHGSLTSSSDAFIKKVLPEYALYPVGKTNRYGFPKPAVLKRYEEIGSQNLLVSETGALMFQLNGSERLAAPLCWREKSHRYWHS